MQVIKYAYTHKHTHTHTHTQTHMHTLKERERGQRENTANMPHGSHYCIIHNLTVGKENMNETSEAIKN